MIDLINTIKNSVFDYYENKISLLNQLGEIESISFTLGELEKLDYGENFEDVIKHKGFSFDTKSAYVYFFKIEGNINGLDIQKLFKEAKESKIANRNFTNINTSYKDGKPSQYLYVGSRKSTFQTRLKQHLGLLAASTGALHLKYWFHKDYKLTFYYFKVPCESMTNDIEKQLRKELNPILGQK